MSEIRTKISKKNPYYIGKYRYLELRYFCLQYSVWKEAYNSLDGFSKRPQDLIASYIGTGDPTAKCAESKLFFKTKMNMVENAAKDADPILANYILTGVTKGLTYDKIRARTNIPCCRKTYYQLYRKFFYLLNKSQNSHLLL